MNVAAMEVDRMADQCTNNLLRALSAESSSGKSGIIIASRTNVEQTKGTP
jgi:hypothetical protein